MRTSGVVSAPSISPFPHLGAYLFAARPLGDQSAPDADTVLMRHIRPTERRDGDEVVREVAEDVDLQVHTFWRLRGWSLLWHRGWSL